MDKKKLAAIAGRETAGELATPRTRKFQDMDETTILREALGETQATVYEDEPLTPREILLKALTKWCNTRVVANNAQAAQCSFENVAERVSRGGFLMEVLNALHNTPVPYYDARLTEELSGEQKRANVRAALNMLEQTEMDVPAELLDVEKIAAGDADAIMELIWVIAYKFQIENLSYADRRGVDALTAWLEQTLALQVGNYHTEWRDGTRYCLLLQKLRKRPHDIKTDSLSRAKRLDHAFNILEEKFELIPILDDEDISLLEGDGTDYESRAVILFLSDIYHYFVGSSQLVKELPKMLASSIPKEDRWATPMTIGSRDDILIDWSSAIPAIQQADFTTDSELVPDVQLVFTDFMTKLLNRAWAGRDQSFLPLKICEANSYNLYTDRIRRLVFIYEERGERQPVILLGFSSEECGDRAEPNSRNRTYLEFLASTCLEDPANRRKNPTLAQAALVAYTRWLELTYKSSYLHIWVDPPSPSMPEYLFRNCSHNISVPWAQQDRRTERAKLMNTYQRIFNAWDFQGYVWRPDIPLPPAFENDFKSKLMETDDDNDADFVNVRVEFDKLVDSAKRLGDKVNQFFQDRTLVIYLSDVTILAKDPADPSKILTKNIDETNYLVEVNVEDVTPLVPVPFPNELNVENMVNLPFLTFYRGDDFVKSSRILLKLVARHMAHPEKWTRDEHQRAMGIIDVTDDY